MLWTTEDLGRRAGISAERIRQDADAGRVRIAGRTLRGVRLISDTDARDYLLWRQRRAKKTAARG